VLGIWLVINNVIFFASFQSFDDDFIKFPAKMYI